MKKCVLVCLILTAIFVWPLPFAIRHSSDLPVAVASEDPIPIEIHAGTQEDPWIVYNSETVKLSFDNTYAETQIVRTDAEILGSDDVKITDVSVIGAENFDSALTAWSIPIYETVSELPNGLYYIHARVWDENGNVSDWSEQCWIKKQWQELSPPGGCVILR